MLKLFSVFRALTPRLEWAVHAERGGKRVCSGLGVFTASTAPVCSCGSEKRLRSSSTYSTSISSSQASYTKEIADKLGLHYDSLMKSVTYSPILLTVKPVQWEGCFKELINNGFCAEDALVMVTKYHPLLLMKAKDLSFAFQVWRGTKLGEKYFLALFKSCPQLLLLPEREIVRRIPHLKALGTPKGVISLLKGAPNIMFENWINVINKLKFLQNEMRIEDKHILQSYALNRSVLFLKTRFVFLERCGKYTKPKVDANTNIPSKNPPLNKIVEVNDEDFATLLAGVTLEEYEVFQELFAVEMENSESSGSDSD